MVKSPLVAMCMQVEKPRKEGYGECFLKPAIKVIDRKWKQTQNSARSHRSLNLLTGYHSFLPDQLTCGHPEWQEVMS